jgi:hypothetical protein
MRRVVRALLGFAFAASIAAGAEQPGDAPRHVWPLDAGWRTSAGETPAEFVGFERADFNDAAWKRVDVPHNWDDYGGAHGVVHGNRHGTAGYRREFVLPADERGRRVFLFFEGVGSYATVWVNGRLAGRHAGGRTTFTLDVTELVEFGGKNLLAVRADHPAGITDLPWVCGGCSTAPGFSEGSQPMGIFRPVHLVSTAPVRLEPFGVHVWNDADVSATRAVVHVELEIKNYGASRASYVIETRLRDPDGKLVVDLRSPPAILAAGETKKIRHDWDFSQAKIPVRLWSPASPALYRIEFTLRDGERALDRDEAEFGLRSVQWPAPDGPEGQPLRVNGEPVFINGTCEYEHVLGASHAFSAEQIRARVAQVRAAGFNAFRDAHQPHNLRYQHEWDRDGTLWWPQFAAQIWFDTPEFRANFKQLLRDWVRERRNSPSLVLWGLANESKLPEDFARECVAIIRELDPTASSQRLITTCNSGRGTDWNVPQNWSGTYGGDPAIYAEELRRARLVGEYGAWRSLGLHTEGGFVRDGPLSEDRFSALMETKIRLAESVRGEVAGHFQWLMATHDNPGRIINAKLQQGSDGWPELDRIGPANNKGLLTLWGEPTDAFYLYRANYARAASDPMVYIVSHTWPDRWNAPGRKSGIVIYSNCDEVELFNDVRAHSLGVRKRGPVGTHFAWDDVEVNFNVLYAEGRVAGKVVATDSIVLRWLPEAPHRRALNGDAANLTAAEPGRNFLYRVNCGGPDYVDTNGQRWLADRDYAAGDPWGSSSWAAEFPDAPARLGSQRETSDAIAGTRDEPLFQTYRYGREKLRYRFAVPDGEYRVDLFFIEPWYGRGGGNCAGWRLFDVAVNDNTVLRDVDLWREAGYAHAAKKTVTARARSGWLEISFPRVASYQAVISAIAISTADANARIPVVTHAAGGTATVRAPSPVTAPAQAAAAVDVHPATRARFRGATFEGAAAILGGTPGGSLTWDIQAGLGGAHDLRIRYRSATPVTVELRIVAADGGVVDTRRWALAPTSGTSWSDSGPEGGLSFNAGNYSAILTVVDAGQLRVESLSVR